MKKRKQIITLLLLAILLAACSPAGDATPFSDTSSDTIDTEIQPESVEVPDAAEGETVILATPGSYPTSPPSDSYSSDDSPDRVTEYQPVTAGVVDDNENWFDYLQYRNEHWDIYANQRDVSERYRIQVNDFTGQGVNDANVSIFVGQNELFNGRTDAGGQLWFHPMAFLPYLDAAEFRVLATKNEIFQQSSFTRHTQGDWTVTLPGAPAVPNASLDLLFLIDATGSMGDEIGKLKATMGDIADHIGGLSQNPNTRYGLVAYRDRGDEYVVQNYDFSDLSRFQNNLASLQAAGGGDYPESVNEALHTAVHNLSWRNSDTVRLILLVGDAPPHLDYSESWTYDIDMASAVERGIKIFPIGASGLDAQGEYIFRQMAQFTGGKFVFLTYAEGSDPSSGPGAETTHDVEGYSVETLDRLIVRLVTEELEKLPDPRTAQNPNAPTQIGSYPAPPQQLPNNPGFNPANPVWWVQFPSYAQTAPNAWYTNGDFANGVDNWTIGHGSNVADVWDVVHLQDGGDRTDFVQLSRSNANTSGGTVWMEQRLDMDVSGFATMHLEADIRLLEHTLGSSGNWCDSNGCAGEYPLQLSVYYKAADGQTYLWVWGFLESSNSALLQNYTVAPTNFWTNFKSPNLLNLNPQPVNLEAIRISGAGWDFQSQVDDVVLFLEVE